LTQGFIFSLCAEFLNPFNLFLEKLRILFLVVTPTFAADRIPEALAFDFRAVFLAIAIKAVGNKKALATRIFAFFS
jgi:hypothetical protein